MTLRKILLATTTEELGLRLGSVLSWFWITRGYQSEGRQLILRRSRTRQP
jgi:hypothetical protein